MSGMAEEMQRRIAADGGAGLPDDAGPAPGNVDGTPQPTPAAPPAGESNTEPAAGGPPETIPYARFKEVNDRFTPFRELEEVGYDADSLRRLASFEAEYLQDPVSTWLNVASNLELPPEIKAAVEAHVAAQSGQGPAEGEPAATPPPVAELPPEVQKRLEYVDQLRERELEAERNAKLDLVVGAWNGLDKQDGFEVPEEHRPAYDRMMYMAISHAAANGKFNTVDELANAARETILEYRNSVLGAAVQRTARGGSPATLPGGGPVSAGPVKFGSLKEASKAAEAAMARGDLPPITGT